MMRDAPWLITCVGVEHDLPLLPHFLRHYRALGIAPDRFVILLNAADAEHPGLARARAVIRDEGITRAAIDWIAPYTSGSMWARRGAAQAEFCAPDAWVLNADVDEFHRWPEPLADCLARADALGVDCIQGVMIDRLAPGGVLAPVAPAPGIGTQFPIRAEVAQAIGGESQVHGRGGTVKIMAAHGRLLPRRGGHRPLDESGVRYLYRNPLGEFPQIDDPQFRFRVPTTVEHVHWTAELAARLELRLATPGVSPAGAEYGRRQLDHIAAHGGISLADVALAPRLARDADRADGTIAPVRPSVPADGAEDWPQALARMRRAGRVRGAIGIARAGARRVLGR
ncbi:hypothetical protein [Profundibacterium mesophilum]|uniref:Glycosyl transferase family 2domain containing protein n=1 Tax=Profundibacterium mesophilum KAUST100406-0324 TaxID=1037889 RepID=A0A921TD88_9RHOB|nr:hypothetical protein [Profundibacterium mesophilum]KAF0675882.1 Glycosyl transferase family 2domain containing protein [Profundibacterium mesophilum KAUST100406-0324]